MLTNFEITLLVTITAVHCATSNNLPSYFKVCRRSDPNLEKCFKNSANELKPLLVKGIPELSIPSCEPLLIPEVVIDQGTGAVSLKSVYKDIKVYGPTQFMIKQVVVDFDKDRMKIKIFLPHLRVECKYLIDGRILMMPISGNGMSNANYSDIDATAIVRAERVKKDGDIYYNIKDFFVDFTIGHASIQLDDLFNGDEDLGRAMNSFLNENWKQVANEVKPVLEDNLAIIFKKFANKIFHKYPIKVLLPP
ncbi:unnamed protein product [Acanthoscelides obtectus]|uniref:Protein takeout-like n=1 Tax=Acanthoscelides obtectus TaxID=200917 RepID=A0A9P0M7Q2_ACAOB|nr:unnamed protein product [Acanthoscelides obtectus]CAK1670921.1 Circadian clock-controlled protein [Acanthoscelides obtectus]